MKVFLFGKHRQLFSESNSAVWWNDDFITQVRLLNSSPTLTTRLERLAYFHHYKVTALGVILFLTISVIATLFCFTLDTFGCLILMSAYGSLLAPLMLMLFGATPLHDGDGQLSFVDALRQDRDRRFSYWAELLETKLPDPLAIVVEQMKTYQKLTAVLTFVLVPVGSALLGAAVGGGLNDTGYVVLFVWSLLLLASTIFVFCPYYWLLQVKVQLEKRKGA